ncbi:hypothetical protein [Natronospora cellulosivora (SeqCode)]
MPKESSPRLKLKNPSTGEFDWDKSWWENTNILDKHPGIKVVTSSTLPDEPWLGQFVFNVDTHSLLVWNSYNWVDQSSGMFDYVQAGEDIQAGKVVYINKDGRIYCANYNLPKDYGLRVLGISVSEIKADEYGLVKRSGLIKNADWQLAAGEVYYLGLDGELTDKEQKNKLNISVGVAFSFDSLSIRIVEV